MHTVNIEKLGDHISLNLNEKDKLSNDFGNYYGFEIKQSLKLLKNKGYPVLIITALQRKHS